MIDRDERFASHRDKAVELFARKGFAQVGMRELATCLGLAPGSLYHHYPSKRHLLLDILEEFYEELLAALARINRRGADNVRAVVRAHVQLHQELPRHFSIAVRDSGCLSVEQQQAIAVLRGQYEARLMELLERPHKQDREASFGSVIASLLGIVHAWFGALRLDDGATDRLLEVALVGAIERLVNLPTS
jgi:AcrR family transcriptional regulator